VPFLLDFCQTVFQPLRQVTFAVLLLLAISQDGESFRILDEWQLAKLLVVFGKFLRRFTDQVLQRLADVFLFDGQLSAAALVDFVEVFGCSLDR
jgi:hypothetical protein